jgi:DnaJ domain
MDPYRTLGLDAGATPAEVKRAYRRLAKAFHPDSAGAAALPRFLAIQDAYEQLATGKPARRVPGSAAGPASSRASAGPEPWRADPAKARRAREQARTNRAGSARSSRPAGASGPAESKPGAGTSKRRSTRKATLGSTSYDEARESTDTTWAGASWYGPTSGEYWSVNPREYADPRKHGPEYQSRARRRSTTTGQDVGSEAGTGEAPFDDRAEARAEADAQGASNGTWDAEARADETAAGGARTRAWATPPREARRGSPAPNRAPGERPERVAPLARVLDAEPRDPMRRLGYALVAWAPIGLASAAVVGQLTGCASYAATCGGIEPLLPWLAQAFILGLLLLVPALARVLAVGSIAVVLALVPLSAFFLAFGASAVEGAPAFLQAVLSLVWVAGVIVAIAESARNRPTTASP